MRFIAELFILPDRANVEAKSTQEKLQMSIPPYLRIKSAASC
jgi:hypothetical protein